MLFRKRKINVEFFSLIKEMVFQKTPRLRIHEKLYDPNFSKSKEQLDRYTERTQNFSISRIKRT